MKLPLILYTPSSRVLFSVVWSELKSSHWTAGLRELISTAPDTPYHILSFGDLKAHEIRENSDVAGTVFPFVVPFLPLANSLSSPAGRSPFLIQDPDRHAWPQFTCNWGRGRPRTSQPW